MAYIGDDVADAAPQALSESITPIERRVRAPLAASCRKLMEVLGVHQTVICTAARLMTRAWLRSNPDKTVCHSTLGIGRISPADSSQVASAPTD